MTVMEPSESSRLDIRRGEGAVAFKAGGSIFVMGFIAVWLCGWVMGEFFAGSQLLGGAEPSEGRAFLTIWFIVWTVGGACAFGYLIWMMFGSERVDANLSALTHSFRVLGLRHTRTFSARDVANFKFAEWQSSRRRNTAISFDYGTRTIRMFYGIESAEADSTINALKASLGMRRDA